MKRRPEAGLVLAPPHFYVYPLLRAHNPGATRSPRQAQSGDRRRGQAGKKTARLGVGQWCAEPGSVVCTCVGWVDKQNNASFSRTQQNEALLFFSKSSWNLQLTKAPSEPTQQWGSLGGRKSGRHPGSEFLESPMGGREWGPGFVCDLEGGGGERRKPGG